MKDFVLKYKIQILTSCVGLLGGLAYWHFVGCAGGTCPIWSNAWASGGYGLLLGYTLSGFFEKKNKGE